MSTQLAERPENNLAPYDPAAKAGITYDDWMTLNNAIFPGAKPESIMLAVSYCRSRRLDVLTKPVHIVPMSVKKAGTRDQYEYRDVIMRGIDLLRIIASRTDRMAGMDEPVFGPTISIPVTDSDDAPEDVKRIDVPEWCSITVYALDKTNTPRAYTHKEFYLEACAREKSGLINSMWRRRSHGQLAKCAEAIALRKAFPEEMGGEPTAEEMEGKTIDEGAITGEFTVVDKNGEPIPDPVEVDAPAQAQAVADDSTKPADKKEPSKSEPAPEPKAEPAKEPARAEPPKPAKEMPVQSEEHKIELPENAVNLLRKKLSAANMTEAALFAKFGNITIGNVNEALRFIAQQK